VDFLTADSLPWLATAQLRLRDSLLAGRLPHSTLVLSPPGLGAEPLAGWMAALALCDAAAEASPCGACASCALLRSDSHPDFHLVQLEADAKQIKVDQVRELIGVLALRSYRGGYKVGIIEGAETLNANGANAFLKTLEEPAEDTLLVLIARPTHRLPATIASRCLRLVLRPPDSPTALAWLKDRGTASDDHWAPALALAGGAPLLALQYNEVGMAALEREMQEGVRAMAAGAIDVTLLAEQWAKGHVGLRIAWLENWITQQVHTLLAGAGSPQSAERVRLPGSLLKPKIRALFELLDCARELRRLASTGINQQLALEALLLGGRTAFAS
jgi:DNA polymerase-3 subunit delta'